MLCPNSWPIFFLSLVIIFYIYPYAEGPNTIRTMCKNSSRGDIYTDTFLLPYRFTGLVLFYRYKILKKRMVSRGEGIERQVDNNNKRKKETSLS